MTSSSIDHLFAEPVPTSETVRKMRTAFLLIGALILPSVLIAQDAEEMLRAVTARHEAECRQAHEVLTRHERHPRTEWAVQRVQSCGAMGGEALAAALRRHRHAGEPSAALEQVARMSLLLIDASIFEAALEIAGDPGAGVAARVQAIRIVRTQIRPGSFPPYEWFLPDTQADRGIMVIHVAWGRPLHADALHQAHELAGRTRGDAGVHPHVRAAAARLWTTVLVRLHCPTTVPLNECMELLHLHDA
jgi:hypothetical protein